MLISLLFGANPTQTCFEAGRRRKIEGAIMLSAVVRTLGWAVFLLSRAKSPLKLAEWGMAVAGIIVFTLSLAAAQTPKPLPLAANDVSILFPVPKKAADLANLIALSDLKGPSGAPEQGGLWSDADFSRFLAIAEDPAVQVASAELPIELPAQVKKIGAWFIAGIRIDPGAPGLSRPAKRNRFPSVA